MSSCPKNSEGSIPQSVTDVSHLLHKRLFYKAIIDPRTIRKPTKKVDCKGVLKVDHLETKVQLELESLSELIYNRVHNYNMGP